ncbi:MAG: DUF3048 domain-containing protein [Anaerolineales bacterium]
MRKTLLIALLSLTFACQPVTESVPTPTITPLPLPSATATETQPYVYLTPTPGYPEDGFGPFNFPTDINPLTGLSTDPAILDRRPLLIKVSNLPRDVRPQSGLSRADIVYEYYTEEGTTRFIAIYYGQDAEQVGSIRSARFFDEHIIRMYRGLFVFGSGDERVRDRLYNADFADRLIVEYQAECPALCRPDPVTNYLMGNTVALHQYARQQGISDERQNLDGMRFRVQVPEGGQAASRVYAWYSAVIYNRWDYDPPSGRYYRYVDVENALEGQPEVYKPLRDALGDVPIAADNVVILLMPHEFYSISPEIVEMKFYDSGPAYAFRDGQVYTLEWVRQNEVGLFSLRTTDGEVYPFKPGNTWFEVMGSDTKIHQLDDAWRFEMHFP